MVHHSCLHVGVACCQGIWSDWHLHGTLERVSALWAPEHIGNRKNRGVVTESHHLGSLLDSPGWLRLGPLLLRWRRLERFHPRTSRERLCVRRHSGRFTQFEHDGSVLDRAGWFHSRPLFLRRCRLEGFHPGRCRERLQNRRDRGCVPKLQHQLKCFGQGPTVPSRTAISTMASAGMPSPSQAPEAPPRRAASQSYPESIT